MRSAHQEVFYKQNGCKISSGRGFPQQWLSIKVLIPQQWGNCQVKSKDIFNKLYNYTTLWFLLKIINPSPCGNCHISQVGLNYRYIEKLPTITLNKIIAGSKRISQLFLSFKSNDMLEICTFRPLSIYRYMTSGKEIAFNSFKRIDSAFDWVYDLFLNCAIL